MSNPNAIEKDGLRNRFAELRREIGDLEKTIEKPRKAYAAARAKQEEYGIKAREQAAIFNPVKAEISIRQNEMAMINRALGGKTT